MNDHRIGTAATRDWLVEEALTVRAHGTVDLPVLATPHLIFMLEDTCVFAAEPLLSDGELTVGTAVHVDHLAATRIGEQVRVHVELVSVRGRRLVFRVEARSGKTAVARGVHERAVINKTEFETRLNA